MLSTKRFKSIAGALAVGLTLSGLVCVSHTFAADNDDTHMGRGTMGRMAQGNERHPELVAARRHLMQARQSLQNGARDFGGHRVKALHHVDEALAEIRLAIQSDRR